MNQDVVGGSRVEDHISKSVIRRVDQNEAEFHDPVLANCDTICATQNLEQIEESSSSEEEGKIWKFWNENFT